MTGAPASRSGSRPTGQAPSGLAGSRFDPSRINGNEMPRRIWLTDEGSGDICWASDPDPSGDGQAEAVEYIRADVAWKLAGPKRSASTTGRRGRRTSPHNVCRHPKETIGCIWRCDVCGTQGGDL